jgi:Tol biopolymer transport system component
VDLTAGTRLGVYEITAAIGSGGMGQVYRATDTRLKRQVAIKILPAAVAADHDRLARFQREAEVLASLNHPHIAAIYGLEESGGVTALVMELVDGADLSQRIARGAIPLDEALPIARQIAEALEAAHEQGIVHRDLKPANVKVRADGTVKVLDFGLAKALEAGGAGQAGGAGTLSMSPTITTPAMTQAGMILGTAAYMSPEQARGRPIDKRSDIWAFGAVLCEMLTGERTFKGEDVSETLASILKDTPAFGALPADTPPRLRRLIERCLDRDVKQRLRDIGEARVEIAKIESGAPDSAIHNIAAATRPRRSRREVVAWSIAAVAVIAMAIGLPRPAPHVDATPPIVRFHIERTADLYNQTATAFALSPDGLKLAHYGAGSTGQQTLFVRDLATGEEREAPGSATFTPQPDSLFWSPDSRQFVRATSAGAMVLDDATLTARPLCDCRFRGGSWNRDGVILLGSAQNIREGIWRVSAGDRTRVAVTKVDGPQGEQDTLPAFLPDGRRFLFIRSVPGAGDAIYIGTLDGDAPKRIMEGSRGIVVPGPGGPHLLWIDAAGLNAQAFEVNTLKVTGAPAIVVAGAAAASASENGVLATSVAGSRPRTIPTWFDRKGTAIGGVGDPRLIEAIALTLDGRKLAESYNSTGGRGVVDIWLRDLVSGAHTRVTFGPEARSAPVWSPDGSRIVFSTLHDGVMRPHERAADGTGGEAPLFAWDRQSYVNDWSSDGRWVIFSTLKPGSATDNDLWVVPMNGGTDRTPVPYLVAPGKQQQAQFSPDGRFLAYGSDQSGTFEIYVQPFPNASDGKWMISSGGGIEPRWSRDGKELFFFAGQTLMAAPVSVQPTFSNGTPVALFDAPMQSGYTNDSHRWQLSPDGKRFLLVTNAGKDQAPPLDIVVNWQAGLRK